MSRPTSSALPTPHTSYSFAVLHLQSPKSPGRARTREKEVGTVKDGHNNKVRTIGGNPITHRLQSILLMPFFTATEQFPFDDGDPVDCHAPECNVLACPAIWEFLCARLRPARPRPVSFPCPET